MEQTWEWEELRGKVVIYWHFGGSSWIRFICHFLCLETIQGAGISPADKGSVMEIFRREMVEELSCGLVSGSSLTNVAYTTSQKLWFITLLWITSFEFITPLFHRVTFTTTISDRYFILAQQIWSLCTFNFSIGSPTAGGESSMQQWKWLPQTLENNCEWALSHNFQLL